LGKGNSNTLVRNLKIHLGVIVAFLAIVLIYFQPILAGKRIIPNDNLQGLGAAKEVRDHYKETWTNSTYGGMPSYHIGIYHPYNVANHIIEFVKSWMAPPACYVLLYLICFYILFCSMKIDPLISFVGAIAFAFTSYNFIILDVGHNTKAMAVAFAGPIIGGVLLCFKRKYIIGAIMIALGSALEIRTKHIQISYYLLMLVLILVLIELIYALKEKEIKSYLRSIAVLVFAALVGVGTNASVLWITYEYADESVRGQSELTGADGKKLSGFSKTDAFMWSYSFGENLTFLMPNAFGGSSYKALDSDSETYNVLVKSGVSQKNAKHTIGNLPMYWGDQPFTEGPAYMGAVVCFLFVLGLLIIKGKMKWWLLSGFLLSVMLAMGKHFGLMSDFFYNYVPLYSKFRSVTMIHVIAEMAMVMMAVLVLQKIFFEKPNKQFYEKSIIKALAIPGGIALFCGFFPGMFFDFIALGDDQFAADIPNAQLAEKVIAAMRVDRASMLRTDALRSVLLMGFAAGILWAFTQKKASKYILIGVLGTLIIIDMWTVNKEYLNDDDFIPKRKLKQPFIPYQADLEILKDKDLYYRVFDVTVGPFESSRCSYFHNAVGGYHPAGLRRVNDVIYRYITYRNMNVFNMLNTKYYIVEEEGTGKPAMKINLTALGNAWFVNNIQIVENAEEEIKTIETFNPATIALIDKRFIDYVAGLSSGATNNSSISLTHYEPDRLEYDANCEREILAVFSDMYYDKGWQAYIDGEEVPHIRVNYILRALKIPEGKHHVEFVFQPNSFFVGEKISLFFSIIIIVGSLFGFRQVFFNKK